MAVSSSEEDEQLEHELRMSIEHAFCDTNFIGQKNPLVLVIEARNEADNEKLKRKSDNAENSKWEKEDENHPFPLKKIWLDFAEMCSELNESSK